ncbi:hypothetical protein [Nonomuraea sp. NPDC049480]|uniref:hypothetical protein n=1 Tax=Nonomuraea sp. NPDC049480 TaxID=3364353 RepID=UPI003799448A
MAESTAADPCLDLREELAEKIVSSHRARFDDGDVVAYSAVDAEGVRAQRSPRVTSGVAASAVTCGRRSFALR